MNDLLLNMYVVAVQNGFLSIDFVSPIYIKEVKKVLKLK